jgi:hypothetical protein
MSNVVADALSCPLSSVATAAAALSCAAIADKAPFDLRDMALRQILCPEVQFLRSSPGLCILTKKVGKFSTTCMTLLTKVFAPPAAS